MLLCQGKGWNTHKLSSLESCIKLLYHSIISTLTLYHTMTTFDHWRKNPFENIMGKEENAGNQHFLLFPQCLLSYERQF